MKHKLWHTKNNYAAKTQYPKEPTIAKDTFLMGYRATLSHQHKPSSNILEHSRELIIKQSKFDELKR